jgi:hypothetical protein
VAWLGAPRIKIFVSDRITEKHRREVEDLVAKIASVNEVQYEHIGIAFEDSDQFARYARLSSLADKEKLLELTQHENLAVRCYAAWGLIDARYEHLDSVFREFLAEDKQVNTYSVCIKDKDPISSVLYHRYWGKISESKRETDPLLIELDGIILNSEPKPYWLLILRALENRRYSADFNRRFQHLAFEELNRDAIFYLMKWYPTTYRPEVRKSLMEYLATTKFSEIGTSAYLDVTRELLKFGDDEVRQAVASKIRTDLHWVHEREKFISLLKAQGIDVNSTEAEAGRMEDDSK